MAILVTGGAGYIGSVTVERLTAKGESIVVLDDLAYGHLESIDSDIPFYQGSAGDRTLVTRIAREHEIESCMHFAGLAYVAESVEKPALYFENNVQQGISLVSALMDAGVRRFIFSSSCTVYGEQEKSPIGEDCPQWPKNPYGWTKFTLESTELSAAQRRVQHPSRASSFGRAAYAFGLWSAHCLDSG